jgi:hypothetical protein
VFHSGRTRTQFPQMPCTYYCKASIALVPLCIIAQHSRGSKINTRIPETSRITFMKQYYVMLFVDHVIFTFWFQSKILQDLFKCKLD